MEAVFPLLNGRRAGFLLPEEYLKITIFRLYDENSRKIVVEPMGNRFAALEEC